ncbi:hypothetical protein GW17_00055330 [Ensete ventricosum]|nr:hypothetical protein GW17_00055330 [Ensete ventricosum]
MTGLMVIEGVPREHTLVYYTCLTRVNFSLHKLRTCGLALRAVACCACDFDDGRQRPFRADVEPYLLIWSAVCRPTTKVGRLGTSSSVVDGRVSRCELDGRTSHTRLSGEADRVVDELIGRLEQADKELNELREGSIESQHQLKEQRVDRHKVDDELLKLMRENKFLKAELPGKSVTNYQQSIGFGWGL